MPLFFVIGGLFLNKNLSIKESIKKNINLLIYYFIFSFCYILIEAIYSFDYVRLIKNVGNTLVMFGEGTLWFLPTLFFSKIIVGILLRINKIKGIWIVEIIYLVSYLFSIYLLNLDYSNTLKLLFKSVVWTWVRVGNIIPYVFFGAIFRNKMIDSIVYLKKHKAICIITGMLSAALLIPEAIILPTTDYHFLNNGYIFVNFLCGFLGFIEVLCLSVLIVEMTKIVKAVVKEIGINSIHYMAIESLTISQILFKYLVEQYSIFIGLIEYVLYFVIVMIVIHFAGNKINNFVNNIILVNY